MANKKNSRKTTDLNRDGSNLPININNFFQSLGNVLNDITALEVNTMVVESIKGYKFIPFQDYQDLYYINRELLQQQGVHESLWESYLELRQQLELSYVATQRDPSSRLYNPNFDQLSTKLPNPLDGESQQVQIIQVLFSDNRFLRSLRKIGELKAALDNRNQALLKKAKEQSDSVAPEDIAKAVKTDTIYAQTIVQIDGDTINRFCEDLLEHPHRDLILQIHKQSVESCHQEWRGLLAFVVDMAQTALARGFNAGLTVLGKNKSNS